MKKRWVVAANEPIEYKPLSTLYALTYLALLLLGTATLAILMFGKVFLPSNDWTSKTYFVGLAFGLISAVGMLMLVRKGFEKAPGSKVKKFAGTVAAPFLGYIIGYIFVVITIPMVASLIACHQVEIPYTVANVDGYAYGFRRCRSPLKLEGLPFISDKICGVRDQFRQTLAPGMQVVVLGYGTTLGLYVDDVRQ